MFHEIEIEVQDADCYNWYDAIVIIKIENWMDDIDIGGLITEKAILWCSNNGLNFEAWDYL